MSKESQIYKFFKWAIKCFTLNLEIYIWKANYKSSILQGEYGGLIVSVVSGVHASESGSLVTLLVERLLGSPYLVVSRAASTLACQRLHFLLSTPTQQVLTQFSSTEITRLLTLMKEKNQNKRWLRVLF